MSHLNDYDVRKANAYTQIPIRVAALPLTIRQSVPCKRLIDTPFGHCSAVGALCQLDVNIVKDESREGRERFIVKDDYMGRRAW